jgi:hypothetical protein
MHPCSFFCPKLQYLSNVDHLLDAQVSQLAHHELRVKGAGDFQLVRLQAANKVRRGRLERGDEAAQLLAELVVEERADEWVREG